MALCSGRMVIECAFGKLKGRFGAFRPEMDINPNNLPNIIHASLILHNFCEMNGESIVNNVTTLPPRHRLPESTFYPNLILFNFAMIFSLLNTSVFFFVGKCLDSPSFDFGYLSM